HDDEQHVPLVGLDLRPPMKDLRVLDRQRMQPEGVADLVQLVQARLEQSQPHEAALGDPGDGLLPRHPALIGPAAVLGVSPINDHPGAPLEAPDSHPPQSMTEPIPQAETPAAGRWVARYRWPRAGRRPRAG